MRPIQYYELYIATYIICSSDILSCSTQAGLYGEALPLAKECLSIITQAEESEEKQENLMYIYGHMANIETQVCNT